jgi:MOSC domain-containing protein YiiM
MGNKCFHFKQLQLFLLVITNTVYENFMNRKGSVVAISISKKRGQPKEAVESAVLLPDWGIEGDAHAGKWHRQVSLLALESIEKMKVKGLKVGPGSFAENITTAGIDLIVLEIGAHLRAGEAELVVTQIGKECEHRCSVYYQAGDCVMPKEGIFTRVVKGGRLRVGDEVEILEERDV